MLEEKYVSRKPREPARATATTQNNAFFLSSIIIPEKPQEESTVKNPKIATTNPPTINGSLALNTLRKGDIIKGRPGGAAKTHLPSTKTVSTYWQYEGSRNKDPWGNALANPGRGIVRVV